MSVIDKLISRFPREVYPAVSDTSSDLYKILNAIASEFEDFYDAISILRKQMNVSEATGYCLELVGNSYNVDKFKGEEDEIYRLRFKSMTGMEKPTLNGLFDITQLFCVTRPIFEEPGNNIINITIPGGTAHPAYFFFTIGSDGDYGAGIGDDFNETAAAIYADVRSSIIVSKSYLEALLNLAKPAGMQINILEGE